MAKEETGTERQERIKREQHRPEQDAGYDEAVRGAGAGTPDDTNTTSFLPPEPPDVRRTRERNDIDDREADRAAADVRRHEHSAD